MNTSGPIQSMALSLRRDDTGGIGSGTLRSQQHRRLCATVSVMSAMYIGDRVWNAVSATARKRAEVLVSDIFAVGNNSSRPEMTWCYERYEDIWKRSVRCTLFRVLTPPGHEVAYAMMCRDLGQDVLFVSSNIADNHITG
jgi:hypothetical protein